MPPTLATCLRPSCEKLLTSVTLTISGTEVYLIGSTLRTPREQLWPRLLTDWLRSAKRQRSANDHHSGQHHISLHQWLYSHLSLIVQFSLVEKNDCWSVILVTSASRQLINNMRTQKKIYYIFMVASSLFDKGKKVHLVFRYWIFYCYSSKQLKNVVKNVFAFFLFFLKTIS